VAYAFVWVKDKAGNISRVPGFDAISFIPSPTTDIELDRNDVRIFRITLNPGQTVSMTFTPSAGDVDVSVFQGIGASAPRIAVSAQNGLTPETVTFAVPGGGTVTTFQVEVRPVVNSRFRISVTQTLTGLLRAVGPATVIAPQKTLDTTPFIADPPAQQAAIDEPGQTFLPITRK
jgi:hypothetical protein